MTPEIRAKRQALITTKCYLYIDGYARSMGVVLNAIEMEMIAWQLENSRSTPSNPDHNSLWSKDSELTAKTSEEAATKTEFFEVKRAVERLIYLQELISEKHSAFVSRAAEGDIPITKSTFDELVNIFKGAKVGRTEHDLLQTLRASVLVMGVTMSPTAIDLARAYRGTYTPDSVAFLNETAKECPVIYPVFRALNSMQQDLFKLAFFPAHMRHMLFVEGNNGMFATLRAEIAAGRLNHADFDMWYFSWVVNCISFDLHKENMASMIVMLYKELSQLFVDSKYDVLNNYLQALSGRIGLNTSAVNPVVSKLATQFAALLGKVDAATASRIYETFNAILSDETTRGVPEKERLLYRIQIALSANTPTPTYVPAFFRNLYKLSGNNEQETLKAGLPVFLAALETYQTKDDATRAIPASFMLLAQAHAAEEGKREGFAQTVLKNYRSGKPTNVVMNEKMEFVLSEVSPSVAISGMGGGGGAAAPTVETFARTPAHVP